MKSTLVAAALVLSGASFATAITTDLAGRICTSTESAVAYDSLSPVLTSSALSDCSEDANLSILYMPWLPTDAQYDAICPQVSCYELVQFVASLNPPNCVLTVPMTGLAINIYALVNAYEETCDAILSAATEAPETEEPVTDAPVIQKPVTDTPVILEPITEDPATETPVVLEPVTEDPSTDVSTEAPVVLEPITVEPATEEPLTEAPVILEPITEEPATEKPATEEPATAEPVTEAPVILEPVTEEPATQEPATQEPATEEPVTDEPVTEPVTDVPTVTTATPLCGW